MTRPRQWGMLPSRDQELLLKTCLLDRDSAIESWREWSRSTDIDRLDYASQRMLPLLSHRLQALGVDDPNMGRYLSVARHIWFENQIRRRILGKMLDHLAQAEIPTLLLKGLAIASLYYDNPMLRAGSDLDILVPTGQAVEASEMLGRHGWRPMRPLHVNSPAFRAAEHSATYISDENLELDLHWHVVADWCHEDADKRFWDGARPITIDGRTTATLNDTDHLFHVCIHGTRSNTVAPMRWVADAAFILRKSTIEWDRFLGHVFDGGYSLRMKPAIDYLRGVFSLPVPDRIAAELGARAPRPVERFEAFADRPQVPLVVRNMAFRYGQYWRGRNAPSAPANFISYLKVLWGARSGNELPWKALRRLKWHLRLRSAPPPAARRNSRKQA